MENKGIENRHEFLILFDVENGNPNGDPDAGNMPRIDYETGLGIVTDVCLKRKIRNYVELVKEDKPGFRIYVKETAILNNAHEEAYVAIGEDPEVKRKKPLPGVTEFMCKNFYDIRTFGAVMSTDINCGQVRGPVQLNFARSIDPIIQQQVTITRMAVTKKEDEEKVRSMGKKFIVPYALYSVEGYVSAHLANKTYFTEEDLELLWQSIENMFEHDHSAARGKMTLRKLIVFRHDSKLGNAPSHKLFDLVNVERKDVSKPPRAYIDYKITIDSENIPSGVTLVEKV